METKVASEDLATETEDEVSKPLSPSDALPVVEPNAVVGGGKPRPSAVSQTLNPIKRSGSNHNNIKLAPLSPASRCDALKKLESLRKIVTTSSSTMDVPSPVVCIPSIVFMYKCLQLRVCVQFYFTLLLLCLGSFYFLLLCCLKSELFLFSFFCTFYVFVLFLLFYYSHFLTGCFYLLPTAGSTAKETT